MVQELKEGYLSESDLKNISSATTSKPMIVLDKDKYDELIGYEANKHYIELGKAVEKAYRYGKYIDEISIDELLEWAEGIE